MPNLEKLRGFFNFNNNERSALYSKINLTILQQDKRIAKFLGTSDAHLIATIQEVNQIYEWVQHKKTRQQDISEEEKDLTESEIDSNMAQTNNNKSKPVPIDMEITLTKNSEPKCKNSNEQIEPQDNNMQIDN